MHGHLGLSRLFHTFFEVQDTASALGVIRKVNIDMVVISPEFPAADCRQILETYKGLFANGICIMFADEHDRQEKEVMWEHGAKVYRFPVDQGAEIRNFVKEWRKGREQQPVRLHDSIRQAIHAFPELDSEPGF